MALTAAYGLGAIAIAMGIATAVLNVLVVPVWAIVDCVRSRSGWRRGLWLFALVVLWFFGAYLYAFIESDSRKLKWWAGAALVLLLVGIGLNIFLAPR